MVIDLIDEIERLQKENAELKAKEFWSNWVYPEGANPEQIQSELVDYHIILENVCLVYDHVTGGLISKANTFAHAVISEADNHYQKLYKELEDEEHW